MKIIDPTHKWCNYISRHPSGFYYKGKGKTAAVLAGRYKGSGTYFRAACEFGGLDWHEWKSEVVETFPAEDRSKDAKGRDAGEVLAYKAEMKFITDLDLCNPYCLNKTRTNYGALTMKTLERLRKLCKDNMPKFVAAGVEAARQPEVNERRKKSIAAAHQDPEKKARILAGQRKPEVRQVRSKIASGRVWWHHPVTGKTRMLKADVLPPEGFIKGRPQLPKPSK